MSSEQNGLVRFEAPGERVSFDPKAQMWSLTEMFQAARVPAAKAPAQWLRQQQTQEFIAALIDRLNVGQAHIYHADMAGAEGEVVEADEPETTAQARALGLIETRRGRHEGGTWAHWQIAAAYAHYLRPEFYLQWNEWALAYRTGQQRAAAASDDLAARVAALEARSRRGNSRARDEQGNLYLRRVTERIVEEVELRNVPQRPMTEAIRAVLRQAGRPLQPIEVTALLQAAGVHVDHPVQISGRLWHMAKRDGDVIRHENGTYEPADEGR